MAIAEIRTVAVIGSGTMGAQIATLAAFSGRQVRLFDMLPEALDRAKTRIETEILPSISEHGPISANADEARTRLTYAGSLEEAVSGVELVIEAVREELETKRAVFTDLSGLAPRAILATNSSSIPSRQIADVVQRPERVLNMHFFAPVWVRSMLELMTCGQTNDDTFAAARAFGRSLGLVTATVQGESKGFIINRIWRAVKRESLKVIDEDVATHEDIDRLWMIFFQTKYAPFGIMDMVGLDVARDIEWSYQRESLDPTDQPSKTLLDLIEEGRLGEKTGAGFYDHPNPSYARPGFLLGDRE